MVDTTGVEIGAWVDRRKHPQNSQGINVKTDIEVEIEQVATDEPSSADTRRPHGDTEMRDSDAEDDAESDEEEEELSSSIGFSLNARLLHAAALREQGNANVPMDPEWEQYLKEAQERGELNIDATREALRSMAGQIAQLHQAQVTAEGNVGNVAEQFQPPAAPA